MHLPDPTRDSFEDKKYELNVEIDDTLDDAEEHKVKRKKRRVSKKLNATFDKTMALQHYSSTIASSRNDPGLQPIEDGPEVATTTRKKKRLVRRKRSQN